MSLNTTLTVKLWLLVLVSIVFTQDREKRQTSTTGPVFSQPVYNFCTSTPTQGALIGQVTLANTGTGSSLFSIPSGTNLAINPTTGQLYLSTQFTIGTQFAVTIQAVDMSGRSSTAIVNVQSGNTCVSTTPVTALTFPQPYYNFRLNTCSFGTFIGQVAVTTIPPGSTITYTTQPPNTNIQLFPNNGLMYLTGTINSSTSFTLTATSSTGLTTGVPVIITSACSLGSLAFSQPSYTFTPTSCTPTNPITPIGQVAAVGGVAFFGFDPFSNLFTINGSTGSITPNAGVGAGTYTLTVRLLDQTLLPTQTTATVKITCSGGPAATFAQTKYTFGPVCTAGSVVGSVSLINPPQGTTYSMTPPINSILTVNPTTGVITLVNGRGISPINFSIIARSPGGSVTIVPVSVSTCTPPSFQRQFNFMAPSCLAGAQIGRVFVGNPSSTIQYSMAAGTVGFAIDGTSGMITTTNALTANARTTITIVATDNSSAQATRSNVVVQAPASCGGSPVFIPDFG